jgi:hypothetical protein|tara:strand:- start:2094 stop:2465 length:372 start_codon:yes stop_codon:yes gene_type:complete
MKYTSLKIFGVYLLVLVLLCFTGYSVNAQSIPDEGVTIVEFNAPFSNNICEYLEELEVDNIVKIDITKNVTAQSKFKIVVVPTIIIFVDGEESKRFQANIMMQLEATKEEVQETIDEIIMSDF